MGKRLNPRTAGSRLATILTTAIVTAAVVGGGVALATVGVNSVGSSEIVNNSVRSLDIRDGAVRSADLKNNDIRGKDIRDGTITGADIRNGQVTSSDIADGTVGLEDLGLPVVVVGFYRVDGSGSPVSTAAGEMLTDDASCSPGDFAIGGGWIFGFFPPATGTMPPVGTELRATSDVRLAVTVESQAAGYSVSARVTCADLTP